VEKIDERNYRLVAVIRPRKRFRIGYASQGQDSSFPREVRAGLLRAAERERLELIVVDNRYQPKVALRNAQHLIREKVDLVIEFQTDEAVAPAIASKYLEAGIPLIAVDIPHPGATYFGANNYQAGLLGGRYLGTYAHTCWNGQVDEVLILERARERWSARAAKGSSRAILSRKPVPPAVFTRHQIITAENVDHFYPNDSLVGMAGGPLMGADRMAFRDAKQQSARTGDS
jgi:ABC-type sugar transport system substrate-binding protein